MERVKAAIIGFLAALALAGVAGAGFVPDPPMTVTIAPDTYLRVLCEQEGAELLYIPGVPGEGWLNCPRLGK